MHLYNLSLQKPTVATHALLGHFSGQKRQELLICKGQTVLELWAMDGSGNEETSQQSLKCLLSTHAFGTIRSVAAVRLTGGGSQDYIVLGSDSGRIMILRYSVETNSLVRVHQELFGKSGCRRLVPGQYLATDPKGRAVMIASVEKQKLVYVLNRDTENHLTISSPLDSHRNRVVLGDCVGLDVGFENPIFACLEWEYQQEHSVDDLDSSSSHSKMLSYFELDLGLNHVVKKWNCHVEQSANRLIALPGGKDGPGGVLVCSEGKLTWMSQQKEAVQLHFPRRHDDHSGVECLIVSHLTHRMKNSFFVLVQTENGDLFKVTFEYRNDVVEEIKLRYYDTIPVALSLCLFKTGFLFCCSETGNNLLFQVESLGDEDGEQEWSSASMDEDSTPIFSVKPLSHLIPVQELQSYGPLIDSKVLNLTNDDAPQIFSLCGSGPNSSVKILRSGLQVSEMISYPLPGSPTAVWALKSRREDSHHSYIVISFVNATLVLSVGETVEEVSDSGFLLDCPTIDCCQLGTESLLQVYPGGVRVIGADNRLTEWQAPRGTTVTHSSCNGYQLAIALSESEVVYFELDEMENLNEYQQKRKFPGVRSVNIGNPPSGMKKFKFLAVGCADRTVRLISLDPKSCMDPIGMQAVNGEAVSVLISELACSEAGQSSTQFLNVGLDTGVLVRTVLDSVTGSLSDSRLRFVGSRPVKLHRIIAQGSEAVVALSSRPWLNYSLGNKSLLHPIMYEALDFVSPFLSEQCPEGILAIADNTLRILTLDDLSSSFQTISLPLQRTPKAFIHEPITNNLVIIESDHRSSLDRVGVTIIGDAKFDENGEEIEDSVSSGIKFISQTKDSEGCWASSVRVLNPLSGDTVQLLNLDQDEAALCIVRCVFYNMLGIVHYAVGTTKKFHYTSRTFESSHIRIYRLNYEGQLELVHITDIEDVPTALCLFQGRLLVGMGKCLRIYDLGKRKMLRKSENKSFPFMITGLQTQGDRIYVSDIQESVHLVRYLVRENALVVFADDTLPRWITKFTVLDYNTICAADKFGNVFVKRLSKADIEDLEDDISGAKILHEKGKAQGAPKKLQQVCEYFLGDMVTSLQRVSLIAGGREVIFYTTLMGSIGILVPFASREDVDFFTALEMHMRQECPPLSGRDHLAYRSYYVPVKAVVDGDLVEMFSTLPYDTKQSIATSLDRSVSEISRQIELIRSRVA